LGGVGTVVPLDREYRKGFPCRAAVILDIIVQSRTITVAFWSLSEKDARALDSLSVEVAFRG